MTVADRPADRPTPVPPVHPTAVRASPTRKSRILRAIARLGAGASVPLSGRRWFPLWGIVRHTGRTSGRPYALPVAVHRSATGFIIPIPFGDQTQWVRNVLAAGTCTLRWRAHEYPLTDPHVVGWAEVGDDYGRAFRTIIPLIGLETFLRLSDASDR
jgi:hypothetical protein